MRKLLPFLLLFLFDTGFAQTPVPIAAQPALSYFEDFSDISNWSNGFTAGAGASRFGGLPPGGSGTIPNGTRLTHNTSYFVTGSAGGVQKDSINQRIMLLATGTTDNTNAAAIDLFLDFTGINAGTLSFDWASVNNGATSSNRKGSLSIYASVDGISFSEITAASVPDITNYAPTSGSIAGIALPASFDNSPTARLRFYYHNGTGGTTGSRPLIAIDNLLVTAAGNACVTPAASPTALTFGNVTAASIQGSFTAAIPPPDEYLVVATVNNSLVSSPADSFVYNPGDNLGDGVVVYRGAAASFTAGNLDPVTAYRFFIFSVNMYCNGIIRYRTADALTDTQSTIAGPPCAVPAAQPTALQFSDISTSSIRGSFAPAPGASGYLVIRSLSSSLGFSPLNGTVYNVGDAAGNGTVVYRGGDTGFVAAGLDHSTGYYFFIFSFSNYACSGGPVYLTAAPLTGQQSTAVLLPCFTPWGNASDLVLNPSETGITGFFNPYFSNADDYLVVMSTANSLSALPQDGTVYTTGSSLGGGMVLSTGGNYSFSAWGLSTATSYYFHVFSCNSSCTGGPKYETDSWLQGSAATTANPFYKFYFGNLHAHSAYSDGNKDNGLLTPADDYAYARDALCMDFLGISEHNHYTASDNPGMLLQYYQPALAQADTFNAQNPDFLALYGMEWGVLSNGGHVLVYGIDSLLGWETVNSNPNYDIFVAKSDYLSPGGLFGKVNSFSASGAFAALAHPSWSDFQNLVNIPYNSSADSSIAGIAVESGPAFSTDTGYGTPGGNMSFLPYYMQMLAKGYHAAPEIDHDNHNTTFGRTAYTRTAVLAPSIAKSDFLAAMRGRRFYATQDCDTRAMLDVYGQPMGSILTHSFAPAIVVTAQDPGSPASVPVIRLMYGVPGSDILPVVIASDTGYALHYTDLALPDSTTAYYYADIMIDGKRTITAPVWYTRVDTGAASTPVPDLVKEAGFDWHIINNPAGSQLQLELATSGNSQAEICVRDLAGRIRVTKIVRTAAHRQNISIPIEGLLPGLYLVELRSGTVRIARKLVHY